MSGFDWSGAPDLSFSGTFGDTTASFNDSTPSVIPPQTSSKEVGPPQRLDLNSIVGGLTGSPAAGQTTIQDPQAGEKTALNVAANVGLAPARALEMPVATMEVMNRMWGGSSGSAITPIGQAAVQGGAGIGDLLGQIPGAKLVSDVLNNADNFSGALINGRDLAMYRDTLNMPDNASIPVGLNPLNEGMQFGTMANGKFGLRTVGDLRANLLARGFTQQELDSVANKSVSDFNFGDHRISTDPIVEAGARMALNPTNLLMFTPAAAARVTSFIKDAADIQVALEGVGLADKVVQAGDLAAKAPDAIAASSAIQDGNFAQATLKGFGDFLGKTGIAGSLDTGIARLSQIGSAYRKISIADTAATVGANVASGWAQSVIPKDNPVYGYMAGIHQLTDAIINDHPFSNSAAFDIVAGGSFPLHDYLGATGGALKTLKDVAFGSDLEPQLARMAGFTDRLGGVGKAQIAAFRSQYGPDAALHLRNFVAMQLARDTFTPAEKAAFAAGSKSAQEFALRGFGNTLEVSRRAEQMINGGKISTQDILDQFKEWYRGQAGMGGGVVRDAEGNIIGSKGGLTPIDNKWNGPEALSRFYGEYMPTVTKMGEFMKATGIPVVPYLKDFLTQENADALIARFRNVKGGLKGKPTVPLAEVRAAMQDFPALAMHDEWWHSHMLNSAKDPALSALVRKLNDLKKNASTLADQTHEFAAREAAAPPASPLPHLATGENPPPLDPQTGADVLAHSDAAHTPPEAVPSPVAAPRLSDRYRQQWIDAGSPPEVADGVAALVEARAKALGVSPDALHQGVDVRAMSDVPTSDTLFQKERVALDANAQAERLLPPPSPESAQARLDRTLSRDFAKVAPSGGKTTTLPSGEIIGAKTPEQWLGDVQRVYGGNTDMLHEARYWYQNLDKFFSMYGDSSLKMKLAWLLSQQSVSPSGGFTNVLRALDQVTREARPGQKIAGLAADKLKAVLSGEVPHIGDATDKIHDFVDSAIGKPTRTLMHDDARGGQPAAGDVWAARDVGYVDETTAKWAKAQFGVDLPVDGTSKAVGEAKYEYIVKFYNDAAKYLNSINFDGGGWTAREAQALGWVRTQLDHGVTPEGPADIVGKNTYHVATDIGAGEGSPLEKSLPNAYDLPRPAGLAITKAQMEWLAPQLEQLTGVKVIGMDHGLGFWRDYPGAPASVFHLVGSPEQIADAMDVIGHVGQQTEVFGSRVLRSAKTAGLTITADGALSDPAAVEAFWNRVKELAPEAAHGAQPVSIDGAAGIRIIEDPTLPKWKAADLQKIRDAVHQASDEAGFDADVEHAHFDVQQSGNNWKENPNGRSYLESLDARGRGSTAARLADLQASAEQNLRNLYAQHAPDQLRAFDTATGNTPELQAQGDIVKGFTQRQGARTLIGLTPNADASTAFHEMWHGIIEPSLTNEERIALSQADSLGENGARNFERYLRDGKAPTADLQGVFARARGLLLDIYQRLKGSPIAQRLSPEVRSILDSLLTPAIDNATEDANVVQQLDPPVRFQGQDFTQEQLDQLKQLEGWVDRNHPSYGVSPQPVDADKMFFMYDPESDSMAGAALRQRTAAGRFLFDYGPSSIPGRFWSSMTTPVKGALLAHDARQAMYSEFLKYKDENGRTLTTTGQVDEFIHKLNQTVRDIAFGSQGIQMFRGATGLPKMMINSTARELWTMDGKPTDFLKAVYNAGDEPADILDRSYNRWMRAAQETIGDPTARGALSRAVDSGYNAFQDTKVGDATRLVTKTFYHIFRFILDPRWLLMQTTEADMMGALTQGKSATRYGGALNAEPSAAMNFHLGAKPVNVDSEGVYETKIPEQTGIPFLGTRKLAGYVTRVFDPKVMSSATKVIDGLPTNDPMTADLVSMFGPNRGSWAKQLNQMLYEYDTKGVSEAIKQSVEDPTWRDANGIHWDANTIKAMSPMIGKLVEANDAAFKDVMNTFYGNPDRAQWERAANNYFLYWPLSYQLKAAHWMYSVLTDRAFGQQLNAAPAATYAHLLQIHNQLLANDPDYQAMFKKHPTLLWLGSMLFPMTPGQEGVSLSRFVRGVGGDLGIWNRYKQAGDPVSFAAWLANLGPNYTFGTLLPALQREFKGPAAPTISAASSNAAAGFGSP